MLSRYTQALLKLFSPEPEMLDTPLPNRNDPCHCGSGRKYKSCCLRKDVRNGRR